MQTTRLSRSGIITICAHKPISKPLSIGPPAELAVTVRFSANHMVRKAPSSLGNPRFVIRQAGKQSAADTNQRGPLFHGDLEVPAHPHREFWER